MDVEQAEPSPGPLGRDAYRIVQEALTNIGKHASGATARVRVRRGPLGDCTSACATRIPCLPLPAATLPGAGAGLLGLRERVALAGGTLSWARRVRGLRGGGEPDMAT